MNVTHVNHDQSISFYVQRPSVTEVACAGSFSNWEQVSMTQIKSGLWFYKTAPLAKGEWQYKFVIDGNWVNDPSNLRTDLESGNSVLHVGMVHGHIVHRQFFSSALNELKSYAIYLPPSYPYEIGRQYPTVYLMGGLFDWELSWVKDGHITSIADDLIRKKKIGEVIIVMPDKDNSCFADGDWTRYSTYITRDLLTHCEKEYRCSKDRKDRAIEGLSLGAGWALRLGSYFPELFSSVSALSGVLPDDVRVAFDKNQQKLREFKVRFRLFCGDLEEELVPHLDWVFRYVKSFGIYCEFFQDKGIHRWPLWRRGIRNSLEFHNFSFSTKDVPTL